MVVITSLLNIPRVITKYWLRRKCKWNRKILWFLWYNLFFHRCAAFLESSGIKMFLCSYDRLLLEQSVSKWSVQDNYTHKRIFAFAFLHLLCKFQNRFFAQKMYANFFGGSIRKIIFINLSTVQNRQQCLKIQRPKFQSGIWVRFSCNQKLISSLWK